MQHKHQCDIRLNAYGQADVDYYLAKARELRAELVARWYRDLKTEMARLVCQPLFGCRGPAASH